MIREELAALDGARLFDAHAHTGIDIDGTTRTSDEHVAELEALGGRSVVFPLCVTGGYAAENRRVIEECRRHPDRLTPFARLDPRASSAGEAADALAAGAVGFKLHPRAEDFRLEHPGVDAILGVAAEAGAPVLVHAGPGVGSYGEALLDLATAHPSCPIVLAHAAVSDLHWLWRAVPAHPNLFFDTAWWNPADLLALLALVPPGRILFGSDAPYMDIELVLAITLRCARFAGLAGEAIELIAGAQLEALLAGEPPIEAGPATGQPGTTPSVASTRLATLLAAAGGAILGGGDPSQMLELALLAAASDELAAPAGSRADLVALVEEAASPSADAVAALAIALTLVMTPEVAGRSDGRIAPVAAA